MRTPYIQDEDFHKYEVVNLDTERSHGLYDTQHEAYGCVRYDKLSAYAIWHHGVCIAAQHRTEQPQTEQA